MINSVQEAVVTLTTTGNIPFASDVVRTRSANCCGWLTHSAGSTMYQITEPGIYEIQFNANVSAASTGVVALAIKNNGEALSGTEMDATIATANAYVNVSANRLIRVCGNGTATITVGSIPSISGVTPAVATIAPTVKNASLIIKKLS